MKRQRGAALLLVLWVLALLSVLLGGLAGWVQLQSRQALWLRQHTQTMLAAQAGVAQVMAQGHWLADGRAVALAFDDARLQVSVRSERGKLYLVNAALQDVTRLALACGATAAQAQQLAKALETRRHQGLAPFRVLKGIEVDILDDGSLDQSPFMLNRLDIVVASVHSKLSMDAAAMTRRMVGAVRNSRVDVLGHCTGRLVEGNRGLRAESKFDAETVFTACRDHGVAVEINSRPERRDPPTRLITMAREIGCHFSIDTDAHAPGQLDFLGYGAQRALDNGVPADRIINTWPVQRLLDWAS